jgi:hypothetical protein
MRRCQRLPELTHPADPVRPHTLVSSPVPLNDGPETGLISRPVTRIVLCRDHSLTSTEDRRRPRLQTERHPAVVLTISPGTNVTSRGGHIHVGNPEHQYDAKEPFPSSGRARRTPDAGLRSVYAAGTARDPGGRNSVLSWPTSSASMTACSSRRCGPEPWPRRRGCSSVMLSRPLMVNRSPRPASFVVVSMPSRTARRSRSR